MNCKIQFTLALVSWMLTGVASPPIHSPPTSSVSRTAISYVAAEADKPEAEL